MARDRIRVIQKEKEKIEAYVLGQNASWFESVAHLPHGF
jgi:hypothetical protein